MRTITGLAILSLLFFCSCSSVPLHVPTITSTNYEVLGEGEGSATGIMLFQFIPIGQNDRFDRAYHYAVESKGGDALIDPVISEKWFWAYVLNGYTTTVTGKVIRYKR
jgi:hypothetical protein